MTAPYGQRFSNANNTYSTPYNIAQPGSNTYSGGTGGFLLSSARDVLDARRMMATGHTPSSEYPDGYLGTIGAGTRRQDRLLNNIGNRATQRSYQRGVHKGERIDPADYYWTSHCNPTAALEFQARGKKWTQSQTLLGTHLVNDGKSTVDVDASGRYATAARVYQQEMQLPFTSYNEERRRQLARFRPAWT